MFKATQRVLNKGYRFFHHHSTIPVLQEQKTLYAMTQYFLETKNEFPDLKYTAMIGNQHVTGPTLGFCSALTAVGVQPNAIGLIPKIYSMSPDAARLAEKIGYNLWLPTLPEKPGLFSQYHQSDISRDVTAFKDIVNNLNIETIIGLGCGDAWARRELERVMPGYAKAYGELTTSGLYDTSYKTLHPIVDFANSALKKELEPHILKILIGKKINEIKTCYKLDQGAMVGIIGNGAIGATTANYALSIGLNVIVFDEDENAFPGNGNKKFTRMDSKEDLVQRSALIIDCTGKNPLRSINLRTIIKSRTLFTSFSSGEDGFLDALNKMGKQSILSIHPLADYICQSDNGSEMIFLYGGKPSTFSDDLVSDYGFRYQRPKFAPVSFPHYEGIACGLFGTFLQSTLNAKPVISDGMTKNIPPPIQQFDPFCQQWIARRWGADMVKCGIIPESEVLKFNDIDWIIKHSGGGRFIEHPSLERCYGGSEVTFKNIANIR